MNKLMLGSREVTPVLAKGNQFKLFQHQWFDYEINDMSWLRADTFSWQDGTVYSNAYNHLVADIAGVTASTETVGGYTVTFYRAADGHKIVLSDQETTVGNIYTATGVAWYYVLDTANNRFKLPRTKYGFDGLRDNVGDYIPESLPNISGETNTAVNSPTGAFKALGQTTVQGSTTGTAYKMAFDASRSSSTYQTDAPVQQRGTQQYLYFYVGQFSQSAIEQTAGLNAELFNNKVDINAGNFSSAGKSYLSGLGYPSDSYIDVTVLASDSNYTAPANGWFNTRWNSNSSTLHFIQFRDGANTHIKEIRYYSTSVGSVAVISTYVRKGQQIKMRYDGASSECEYFRFYYAEGETNV